MGKQQGNIWAKTGGRDGSGHSSSPDSSAYAALLRPVATAHLPGCPSSFTEIPRSSLGRRLKIGRFQLPMAAAHFEPCCWGQPYLPSAPAIAAAADKHIRSGGRLASFLHSVRGSVPGVATGGKTPEFRKPASQAFLPKSEAHRPPVATTNFHHFTAPCGHVKLGFPKNWEPTIPSNKDQVTGEVCQ